MLVKYGHIPLYINKEMKDHYVAIMNPTVYTIICIRTYPVVKTISIVLLSAGTYHVIRTRLNGHCLKHYCSSYLI